MPGTVLGSENIARGKTDPGVLTPLTVSCLHFDHSSNLKPRAHFPNWELHTEKGDVPFVTALRWAQSRHGGDVYGMTVFCCQQGTGSCLRTGQHPIHLCVPPKAASAGPETVNPSGWV